MNLLFNGGCVWGFFEYIGTIQYIKEKNIKIDKLYGVSAGSAIALCLLLDIDVNMLVDFCIHTVDKTKFKSFTEMHIMGCEYVLKQHPDAYKRVNNRLYIGLTGENGFYFKHLYTSNLDLANTIICSSSIPIVTSYETICDKQLTIDGGFSFCPKHVPKHTIVVTPTVPFPISALPPPELIQRLLILLGHHNMRCYIQQKNNATNIMWYTDPKFSPLWFYLHNNVCIFERKTIADVSL